MASQRNTDYAEATGEDPNSQSVMARIHKLVKAAGFGADSKAGAEWLRGNYVKSQQGRPKAPPTAPEAAAIPPQIDSVSVPTQVTTKKGKEVKAILKDGKVIAARGTNEVSRGRQANEHRKAITVSKGKVVNIYLESEFERAADKVAAMTGTDRAEWFKRVINSNSELNPTAALRLDIVKTLTGLLT